MTHPSRQQSSEGSEVASEVTKNFSPVGATPSSRVRVKPPRTEKRREYERALYRRHHPNCRPFRKRRPNHLITKAFILENIIKDPVTGCWNWQLSKMKGYGRVWNGKRYEAAHRVAYELWIGPIPWPLYGCHKCDNRACCNPDHVFLGTHQENIQDASIKGRLKRQHKVTDAQIVAIRKDPRIGRLIANDYGISDTLVYGIKCGRFYSQIK